MVSIKQNPDEAMKVLGETISHRLEQMDGGEYKHILLACNSLSNLAYISAVGIKPEAIEIILRDAADKVGRPEKNKGDNRCCP